MREIGKYIEAKASARFKKAVADAKVASDTASRIEKECRYERTEEITRAVGGKPEFATELNSDNYNKWLDSIEGNEVWMDYYPNSLIMLSDFADEEKRKTELSDAINEHLNRDMYPATDTKISLPTGAIKRTASKISKGYGDINSMKGRNTGWTIDLSLLLADFDPIRRIFRNLVAQYTYTVEEMAKNNTKLRFTTAETYNIERHSVTELMANEETQSGTVRGQSHGWNEVAGIPDDKIMRPISVVIDGKGDDYNNIQFATTLNVPVKTRK